MKACGIILILLAIILSLFNLFTFWNTFFASTPIFRTSGSLFGFFISFFLLIFGIIFIIIGFAKNKK